MGEGQALACVAAGVVYLLGGIGSFLLASLISSDGIRSPGFILFFALLGVALGVAGGLTCARSWPPGGKSMPTAILAAGGALLLLLFVGLAWLAMLAPVLGQGGRGAGS